MPANENSDPNDLHSRLDPADFNTIGMGSAPKTPPLPRPKVSEEANTLPLQGADASVPGQQKQGGFFRSVGGLKNESDVAEYPEGGSSTFPKSMASPTPLPMPPANPPTPRINPQVIPTRENEKPDRRGTGILGILIGLLQFLIGLLLLGVLLVSIAPLMADYDGPIGVWGGRIEELVRPYALDLCLRAPIRGCFGYGDLTPDDEPESSHGNMPGLCMSPCDPDATTSTCAEGLECVRDAAGEGYCYSASSPLCVISPTPTITTQTTTGGSTTSGTNQSDQPASQADDPCKDRGGVVDINPAFCSCQSITYTIITCADGFKAETPNANSSCNPDPANCQQPPPPPTDGGTSTGGGAPACEYKCFVVEPTTGKCSQGGWVYPGTNRVCDPQNP